MTRVALAAVFHETNSFSALRTDEKAFRATGWLDGDALVERYTGTRTVMGGFLDGLSQQSAVAVPAFGAYATPSGLVPRETFAAIRDHLLARLQEAEPFDGLLLELHGALVVEQEDDPEQVLCREIRSAMGERPVVAVTDLHANMTPARLDALDALVGYRTNPHVDTYETGVDAARLLGLILRDRVRPAMAHARVPVLAAPIAQRTAELPLLRLLHRARELERSHRLLDVTVHGGYAYADVPYAGLSVTATARERVDPAAETVTELARMGWAYRHEFRVDLPDPPAAVNDAAGAGRGGGAVASGNRRPVAIADTGDNIGGGAHGDNVWLLREALARPDVRSAVTVCDADAVAAAERAGVGAEMQLSVGGRSNDLIGDPVEVHAQVRWVGDGTFRNRGPMARGAQVSMGRAATVRAGSVDVVLQSRPIQPNDPELFRCAEVEPSDYDVVILKGASALRAGWADLVSRFVDAGTPGVTDCNLARLPYRRLANTIWPLAEVAYTQPRVHAPLGAGIHGDDKADSMTTP